MSRTYINESEKEGLLNASIAIIAEEDGQVTLRHLFYRLVGLELIDKTETAYHRVVRYTKQWRHSNLIPYSALADNTRWFYGSVRYNSPEEAVANALKHYRRNLWENVSAHVEIWTEKDAMVSILLSEAENYGVKVFSTRGYASIGSIANTCAPQTINQIEQGNEVFIYYFGDYDPSGTDISRAVELEIGRHLTSNQKEHFIFERSAILPEDIEIYDLPTRPTKKSDPRSKKFKGNSVELDAMDMRIIKERVRNCILDGMPPEYMKKELVKEKQDKERIFQIMRGLQSGERLALGSSED